MSASWCCPSADAERRRPRRQRRRRRGRASRDHRRRDAGATTGQRGDVHDRRVVEQVVAESVAGVGDREPDVAAARRRKQCRGRVVCFTHAQLTLCMENLTSGTSRRVVVVTPGLRRRRAYRRAYVASPRLTTTNVGLTPRLAYARVVHTAPDE